jgi:tetratricopeptide (TPR) repeat protein
LAKVPGLKVAARSSAFAFKGRNQDVRAVGSALGVAHILEGSLRTSGSRLRVTAQLIAIADGCHLWSERFDRQMTDVFAIQDEISQAIVDVLKMKLGPVSDRPQVGLEAYQAYLEGRYQFQQMSEASLSRSRECFERAIALEPGYAAANAGLSETYIYLSLYTSTPTSEIIPRALEAAERAIRLDPNAADGFIARAVIRGACEHNWAASIQDLQRALVLKPDSPLAHYRLGIWCYMPLGQMGEAVREARRAVELDPLSMLSRSVYSLVLHVAGENEAAIRNARAAREQFPGSFLGSLVAGWVLGGLRVYDEAIAALQEGLRLYPGNIWLLLNLAVTYARQGNRAEVMRILSGLEARQDVPSLVYASIHAASGNLDLAFRWFDRAVEERNVWTPAVLRIPIFTEGLAGPRYDALLRKMHMA